MNTTLIVFVVLYLVGTLAIGVWAGTRIKNTADFAIAFQLESLTMSSRLAMPNVFANRPLSRSFLLRWMPTFLGFPAGGSLAMVLTGPVNAPAPALAGAVHYFSVMAGDGPGWYLPSPSPPYTRTPAHLARRRNTGTAGTFRTC